ncbi:MAG: tetratricopeptide repeat protein, partial [Nannocystaceae bacterium]
MSHDDATLPGNTGHVSGWEDRRAPRTLSRGDRLGRYTVLELRGQGGMGQVYAAYDPQLDRRIALKVLRTPNTGPAGEPARQQLLLEAQAMARLSHPHVVTVHDVGAVDDEVFIAMEFVDGPTLDAWLDQRPRSAREIVEVFAQAGQGLAAAHAAGLVHRDFKPANVLIDAQDRAKVTDFGLVRADDTVPDQIGELREIRSDLAGGPTAVTTNGFKAVGTPAYMAPEQHANESIDARTDQFGFCVALYDALYGEHPFGGGSLFELISAVSRGERREPPAGASVPVHVRRAVLRGLERKPDDRWPDMTTLLETLLDDPERRRWRWIGGGVAVVALGALVVLALRPRPAAPTPPAPCEEADRGMDEVWSPTRSDAIGRALAATGQGYAPALWSRGAAVIDDYAQQWRAAARDACEATQVRGEQSDSLFDRRRACLESRRQELDARLSVLQEVDEAMLDRSFAVATSLVPIEVCEDVDRLQRMVPLPDDPKLAQRVLRLQEQLAEASAEQDAGRATTLADPVARMLVEAEEIGYAPLLGDARRVAAGIQEDLGLFERAETLLRRAALDAAAGRDDRLLARIWIRMPYLVGYLQGRGADVQLLSVVAEAALIRIGRPDELVKLYEHGMGASSFLQGDYEQAQAHYVEALLHTGEGDRDALFRAKLINNLAVLEMHDGHYDEARDLYEQSLVLRRDLVRPDDLGIGEIEQNLASIAAYRGDFDSALEHIETALGIARKAQPDGGPQRLAMLINRSMILVELGEVQRAQGDIDDAHAMAQRLESGPATRMALLDNTAHVQRARGQLEAARATNDEAIELAEKTFGPKHYVRGLLLGQRGAIELEAERLGPAAKALDEALTVIEDSLGPNHPHLAAVLRKRGDVALQQGSVSSARPPYERAIAILEGRSGDRRELARARFGLARTLPPSQHARATELATEARARLAEDERRDEVAEIDAWLDR